MASWPGRVAPPRAGGGRRPLCSSRQSSRPGSRNSVASTRKTAPAEQVADDAADDLAADQAQDLARHEAGEGRLALLVGYVVADECHGQGDDGGGGDAAQ
jgi:hypothetical protein